MNTDTIKDWLARKTELAQKEANNPEEYMAKCEQLAFTAPLALEIVRLAVECLEEAQAEFERVHKVKDYNTTFSNTLRKIQTLIESSKP